MNNNDILRRLRYTFEFGDSKMISVFGLGNLKVTREQISDWLKKEDDAAYKECNDMQMAIFLNGLIIEKRGKKKGSPPEPEKKLTNNIIFTKLKIALNLKAEDVLDIMDLAKFKISRHELSAFFRKPDNRHYRVCQDQILRNFLKGMQLKYRQQGSQKDIKESTEEDNKSSNQDDEDTSKVKPIKFKYKSVEEIKKNKEK
jgi:uncharacterized protein YehS (DUF1456 family)